MLRSQASKRLGAMLGALLAGALVMSSCGDSTLVSPRLRADGGGGAGDSSGNRRDSAIQACATGSQPIQLRPLDMLLALDTSYSMNFSDPSAVLGQTKPKLESVRPGIEAFVSTPAFAGMGVGLQFFPLRALCSADAYSQPAVPIGILPDNETALETALDQRVIGSQGTPLVPVLEGVLAYMKAWAEANRERKAVVVLATDGIPDDSCLTDRQAEGLLGGLPNTMDNAIAVVRAAQGGSPSISTFVIGVGKELTALNQIAAAGGTDEALLLDTAQDVEGDLITALENIRRRAIFCELDIPGARGSLDYSKVNVRFTYQGVAEDFGNVTDAAGCARAPTQGWYYDNLESPNRIKLCEQTCNRVQGSIGGQLDIVLGCASQIY